MIGRFIYRFALVIVAVWAVVAIIGNSFAPPVNQVIANEDQPFLLSGTATELAVQRSADAFSQPATDNIAYLVLQRDGDGGLNNQDREFYAQLVAALRADSRHVLGLMDWWQVPASTAVSKDHHVVTATMRLNGMVGTSDAADSIVATRNIAAHMAPPDGLHVYITGAGATIMDEFGAVDRQVQIFTVFAIAVLVLLLLIFYRSLITALVPLVSVLMALAVCRPVVSELAAHDLMDVSLFSLSVSVAVIVGAGTGFVIFLIGRYHERRSEDMAPPLALADAYRTVAPVIIGSTLIVVAPLGAVGWLSVARISMFATTGVLCAIGALAVGLSALTLTPALMALASRAGLLEPPPGRSPSRRWRRIGINVARWPAPILVATGIFVLVLTIGLPGIPIGWDETWATSPETEANRGYRAVNAHFGPNQLHPDVVTIETGHDLRNPAGLRGIEQVTAAIMGISGVRMVQSASHPAGMVSKQAALTATAGNFGDRLDEFADQISSRPVLNDLSAAVDELLSQVDLIQSGMSAGPFAIGGVSLAVHLTQQATDKVQARSADVSGVFDSLRSFVSAISDCPTTPVCAAAQEAVQWANAVVDSATKLIGAAQQLIAATVEGATSAGPGLPTMTKNVWEQLNQTRTIAANFKDILRTARPVPAQDLAGYLQGLAASAASGPGSALYASRTILTDPRFRPVLGELFSPDGHATRLFVYGDGQEWGNDGAVRAREISAAVTDAIKNSTLQPATVDMAGVGPAIRDLQDIVGRDLALVALISLGVILLIAAVLLRSPIAGLIVLGTIGVSYLAALGASALIWQRLMHHELHWSVPPIAFLSLVGVAVGGNLLFPLRIREGHAAGVRTSVIRAFAATGVVVTGGGIVVGLTTLALAASSVLSLAQIGVTVGVALLLNALVVRTFMLPAVIVVLDRWLWWPREAVSDEPEREPVTASA